MNKTNFIMVLDFIVDCQRYSSDNTLYFFPEYSQYLRDRTYQYSVKVWYVRSARVNNSIWVELRLQNGSYTKVNASPSGDPNDTRQLMIISIPGIFPMNVIHFGKREEVEALNDHFKVKAFV